MWGEGELLKWIQQKEPKLLKGDRLKTFKGPEILGKAFLIGAGNKEFFKTECNLPIVTSERLADLAKEIVEGEPPSIKSKLQYIFHTIHTM